MSNLEGKVALVTGASSGIGLAVARLLATRGCRIVAAARRADRLAVLQEDFAESVLPLTLDVRDQAAVKETLGTLPADFAALDILVNNAGLGRGDAPVEAAEIADWDEMVDTNIKGFLYVLRAVLPGMLDRGRGHIVNLGSVAATYSYPGSNVYGGTKAFVQRMSGNLRTDLVGRNIRVTDIQPGAVATEFTQVRLRGDAARAATMYQGYTPLAAEDIAEIIGFAVSQPAHVNINAVEVMPTEQAAAGFRYGERKPG